MNISIKRAIIAFISMGLPVIVSNMTKHQNHGFCRLKIPHALSSPPYTITINNKSMPYTTINENDTTSIIYFSYEHSTLEIVIISKISNDLTFTIFIVVTSIIIILAAGMLLATIVRKRKMSSSVRKNTVETRSNLCGEAIAPNLIYPNNCMQLMNKSKSSYT